PASGAWPSSPTCTGASSSLCRAGSSCLRRRTCCRSDERPSESPAEAERDLEAVERVVERIDQLVDVAVARFAANHHRLGGEPFHTDSGTSCAPVPAAPLPL